MVQESKSFFSARNIAMLALLAALTVVLQLFASSIPLPGGLTMNFSLIPIALAAMLLGPASGALMGFICGSIVYITCAILGGEPFTAMQFQASPVVLTLVCIGKTTIAGLCSGFVYKALSKANGAVQTIVASLTVPVVNTLIYSVGCVIIRDVMIQAFGLDASVSVWALFALVFATIWVNFVLEIAITTVLSPSLNVVVKAIDKSIGK